MRVTIVRSGDWEGIVVDGILRYEGHAADPEQVLEAVGIPHTYKEMDEEDIENYLHGFDKQLIF